MDVNVCVYEFVNCYLESPGQMNTVTFNLSQGVLEMVLSKYTQYLVHLVQINYTSVILLLSFPLYEVH